MRILMTLIRCAAILGVASAAHASVTLTVRGTDQNGTHLFNGSVLSPGDQVILDITARSDGEPTFGLGASATGYDTGFLSFNSGEKAFSLFSEVCDISSGCVGGLDNTSVPHIIVESSGFGSPEVRFFNAISLSGTTQSGANDLGVSGIIGDPQARLVFDVVGLGGLFDPQSSINVGTYVQLGDALILTGGAHGSVQTIWVTPEPSTALLLALGLTALAIPPADN